MATAQVSAPSQGPLATVAPGSSPGASVACDLIPLRAVFGQDEANHGTARYAVDNGGLVWVPVEAAGPLTAIGGFALAKSGSEAVSVGALGAHHDNAAGCSYRGRQYLRDANGDVLVPAEATSELLAHGFVPVLEELQPHRVERDGRQAIVP
jgi:hypothetical protein